ncbi:MAG TPA: phosphatase PAP2 family protein [Chitinophagaceae bacterium]|nr:phosphatase PAP2 family protein [Chitinophagaceae bacterium]
MTLFEILERIDKIILLLVNHDSSHQYLDTLMLYLRNPLTWIPFYVFMACFFYKRAGHRFRIFILCSLVTIALTDSISTLLKNAFERLRPCYDYEIGPLVRHLTDCGGLYSFPSSHAANHFGLATFWFWSVLQLTGKKWKFLWIWAMIICYAQMYVGKHFPSDIIAGALLGFVIGSLVIKALSFFEMRIDKIRQVSFNVN